MAATVEALQQDLSAEGLTWLGGFATTPEDTLPETTPGARPATLALVGNAGSAMWRAFQAAPEFAIRPDPMNAWTRRVLTDIAQRHGAQVVFPFDGPPYWPFQQWALRAGGVSQSPLGLLVHGTYGPWLAYRGALLFDAAVALPAPEPASGPCETCAEKPCLDACPAGALTRQSSYDVGACRGYVASDPEPDCAARGCLVRHACPFGRDYVYDPAQARFHMAAFVR